MELPKEIAIFDTRGRAEVRMALRDLRALRDTGTMVLAVNCARLDTNWFDEQHVLPNHAAFEIMVERAHLVGLVAMLRAWRDELRLGRHDFSCEHHGAFHCLMHVPASGFFCDEQHPVFELSYISEYYVLQWRMVIDPSCVQFDGREL